MARPGRKGRAEGTNEQLIALSAWRRLWQRLRVRGKGPEAELEGDEAQGGEPVSLPAVGDA